MIMVSGEALIDLIPDPVKADAYDAVLGGSPYNVAIGLSRLGAPTAFIARETHSSPPVPATTMTRKRMTSSKLTLLHSCRAALKAARVALPDDQDTQADDSDPQPAQRRNRLA